jgi:hypothetical protein
MKRPADSSKAASLARKRALIRALIEQSALNPAGGASTASPRDRTAANELASIIRFPTPGK